MECVFCKIVKGEIPCFKIFEDDATLAFLDIAGDADGHTLVIPKTHAKNILDCPEKVLSSVMKTVQKVSKHYTKNCGFDGVNILNANEECSGQSVFHLHFHIFPRKKGDDMNLWPKLSGGKKTLEEMYKKLKMD